MVDASKCRYCGRRGHGAAPVIGRKKEVCPAYDKSCNACGGIGHFSKTKACRKRVAKVEVVGQCEIGDIGEKPNDKMAGMRRSEVKLSMNRPAPHMVDVGGKLVVTLPRDHPKLRVQLVLDNEFYKEHGLVLRLRRCV